VSSTSASILKKETSLFILKKNARFKVALVYPNTYKTGMSNLGVHSVYESLNKKPDTLCQRFFYDPRKKALLGIESSAQLCSYDVIAFSVSYELDYVNFFRILKSSGLLALQTKRAPMPVIITGGIVNSYNFKPLSKYSDAVFCGEAEESLNGFMKNLSEFGLINSKDKKEKFLDTLKGIKGIYVPGHMPVCDVRNSIIENLNQHITRSVILSPQAEFSNTYLVEISRGCPWQCKYCVSASVTGNYRARSFSALKPALDLGLEFTNKIGLVAAAVSDHPHIDEIIELLLMKNAQIGVSSLRIESVSENLLKALAVSGQNSITFAPEAGTEKLRYSLNKKISDQQIVKKIELARACGIKKIKLYFMVGLPQETRQDIQGIVNLANVLKKILPLRLNLGIFVPKPKTPFACEHLIPGETLRERLRFLKRNLADVPGLTLSLGHMKESQKEFQFAHADENYFDNYLLNKEL